MKNERMNCPACGNIPPRCLASRSHEHQEVHLTVNINISLADYSTLWLDTLKKSESVKERTREIYEAQVSATSSPPSPPIRNSAPSSVGREIAIAEGR